MEEQKVMELKIDDILPNRFQPRIKFDEIATNQLAESIKKHGIIQPILVREIGDKYEIIAGERRYKASVLAGKVSIPAIVKNLNDKDSAEIALVENIQREDLTPIEEAVSYKKILDMGYLNQEGLAKRLDKSQSVISNKLRLLTLDEEVQEALLNNQISERHARSLLKIDSNEKQKELLKRIIEERLTVRKTDDEIDRLFNMGIIEENNKKEDIIMNEENKSVFNIPSTPIIEEIEIFDDLEEEEQPSNIINYSEEEQETNFKPGFLDIDKIEKTAEDINLKKGPVDMDSLLEVDEQYVEEESGIEEGPQMVEGKFFSFVEEEPTEEEEEISSRPSSLEFDSEVTPFENEEVKEPLKEILPIETKEYIEPDYDFDFNQEINNDQGLEFENIPLNKGNDSLELSPPMELEKKDFNEVINEIREYSKKIESYGYYVDLDELDFGDSYQIIFKINKN